MEQDELIGFWINDPYHDHFNGGYGIEFLPGAEGFFVDWKRGEDETKARFLWQRVGDKQIVITFDDEVEWETIEYEIVDLTVACGWHSITEKGKQGFWGSDGALGRRVGK